MMINKRLMTWVKETKKYILLNVVMQWIALIANIIIVFTISNFLVSLRNGVVTANKINIMIISVIMALAIRFTCTLLWNKMSYISSSIVKKKLRHEIYNKLLTLGTSYSKKVSTSEVVQVAVEGVEQLETYFASYLPQFLYSIIAPITLFVVTCFINIKAAIILFVCVPLIPISIALVQSFAKKLLSKYWNQYAGLGDTFLENLQGLVTLKIYKAEEYKSKIMDEEAEKFRKITMKVLIMQLNSISIMDLVAYGGAGLGIIVAINQYGANRVSLVGCLMIMLLSAEFFLPMRLLGSYFHIAMNGMAASDKIFKIMDMEKEKSGEEDFSKNYDSIKFTNMSFGYNKENKVLKDINMDIPRGQFIGIVGESGCGKSTLASLIIGENKNYLGSIKIGNRELNEIKNENIMKNITYIGHNSYLFKGTVMDNLKMGDNTATEEKLWEVLERTKMADFLKTQQGLHTPIMENASNLSGGQRQRIALARAILKDSSVYIFDESTSNIDVESEDYILKVIEKLSEKKTIIFISHRLLNMVGTDNIFVVNNGQIVEQGNHKELLRRRGQYYNMWSVQQTLEVCGKEGQYGFGTEN